MSATQDQNPELQTEALQGVQFKGLTESIDTGTPSGRFFFHVYGKPAEMERELIVERTRAGLEVARQLGRIAPGYATRLEWGSAALSCTNGCLAARN